MTIDAESTAKAKDWVTPLGPHSCWAEDFADVTDDDIAARQAVHLMVRRGSIRSTSQTPMGLIQRLPPWRAGARDTPPIFDGVPRVRDTEKDKTPLSLIIS